ncbi:hypothetical protein JW935_05205 [candidate division KSB1 bacterium]|nr:hypothetical protein [candidate division KSB1 bacterium]
MNRKTSTGSGFGSKGRSRQVLGRVVTTRTRIIDEELNSCIVHLQEVAPDKRLSEYMQTRRIHIEKSISRCLASVNSLYFG